MSYHAFKNAEQQVSQFEGQGFANKAAYGSSSEASINEVMHELSGGQAQFLKKGLAGSSAEEGIALESQGGGFKTGGKSIELSQSLSDSGSGHLVGQLKKLGSSDASEVEFSKAGGKGIANHLESEISAGKDSMLKQGGYGEAVAHKTLQKQDESTWDRITNAAMFGLGAALGPAGFPIMLHSAERMMRDSSTSSYGESKANGYHGQMIQRGKMLKSWKSSDE